MDDFAFNMYLVGLNIFVYLLLILMVFRLESMSSRELFERLDCSSPVSGSKFKISDAKILNSLDCGSDLLEVISMKNFDKY